MDAKQPELPHMPAPYRRHPDCTPEQDDFRHRLRRMLSRAEPGGVMYGHVLDWAFLRVSAGAVRMRDVYWAFNKQRELTGNCEWYGWRVAQAAREKWLREQRGEL